MRSLFAAAVAGLAVVAAGMAQEPQQKATPIKKPAPKKKVEPTLKVGDKAPAFKADKWLQGDEVKGFEKGKVYVVEFWQTWCGPCIVMMPHLADLAEEYKPKGVTVIGFAGSLGNDTTERIEEFVKKRGPKLGYTMAHSPNRETTDAWLSAAGQNGIPCCFVVNKQGTIDYIGHPMFLDGVLPKVVAGTWDAAKGKEEVDAIQKVYREASMAASNRDAAEGYKKMTAVLAEQPAIGNIPYLLSSRLRLLVRAEKFDDAKKLAESTIAKAAKRDDTAALATVASAMIGAKDRPELVKLALKAADTNLQLQGEDNLPALMTASSTYAAAGKADKAKALATKAVPLAEKTVRNDKDWSGQLRLASVYKAAGEADKAKAAAQKALDAAPEQAKQMVATQAKQYGVESKKKDDDK